MLHLFVAWIHLTAAWVRLNALIWCYLLTSRALCDPEVLELAENRTIARRASADLEAHVAQHGSLWRMLYTLFGWLDIEDWQMMLGGVFTIVSHARCSLLKRISPSLKMMELLLATMMKMMIVMIDSDDGYN